jgi:uncharacterized protein YigA (DUF484 family)
MGKLIPFEERAVATLRDRLGAAESANQDLVAFARGHSGATASIHAAVLALMEADSVDALFDVVTKAWPRILGLDVVTLALVADGQGFRVHQGSVELVERKLVDRAIDQVDGIIMRTASHGHALFGREAAAIRSEAVIPLHSEAPFPHGLLLLGQKVEAGLDARHGAQLLGFLGDGLRAMIRQWLINR